MSKPLLHFDNFDSLALRVMEDDGFFKRLHSIKSNPLVSDNVKTVATALISVRKGAYKLSTKHKEKLKLKCDKIKKPNSIKLLTVTEMVRKAKKDPKVLKVIKTLNSKKRQDSQTPEFNNRLKEALKILNGLDKG